MTNMDLITFRKAKFKNRKDYVLEKTQGKLICRTESIEFEVYKHVRVCFYSIEININWRMKYAENDNLVYIKL